MGAECGVQIQGISAPPLCCSLGLSAKVGSFLLGMGEEEGKIDTLSRQFGSCFLPPSLANPPLSLRIGLPKTFEIFIKIKLTAFSSQKICAWISSEK